MSQYAKAWVALAGAAIVLVAELVVPDSAETIVQILAVAGTGAATYRVPNGEPS